MWETQVPFPMTVHLLICNGTASTGKMERVLLQNDPQRGGLGHSPKRRETWIQIPSSHQVWGGIKPGSPTSQVSSIPTKLKVIGAGGEGGTSSSSSGACCMDLIC